MERKQRYKLIKTKHAWVRVAAATTFMAGGLALGGTSVFADTNVTPTTQVAAQTNANQAQIDHDNQAINSDKSQIADNNSKIANDQAQVADQTQKINDANTDYNNTKATIDKNAADATAKAQQTTSDLENKEKTATTSDIQNQINADQGQKTANDAQVANTQGQIKDVDNQISSLQNQPSGNSNQIQIANSNVPGGQSTLDKDKSLLQNTAQDNLWNPAARDGSQPNNGNGVPNMIYVTPDEDENEKAPKNGVNLNDPKYKPLFDIDQIDQNTGMTDQQKQELAEMLMNTLNNTRIAHGLKPMTMTTDKYNQAQVRAAQPSAADITHNKADIASAFGSDQYENLAYIRATHATSMMQLYLNSLGTMYSMMNGDADSNWGHRENYLMDGQWNGAFGFKLLDNGFYTFTFDFNNDNVSGKTNMMDQIKQYATMGPIKSTATDNSAKIAQLQNQKSQLQSQLAQQQQVSANLQTQIDNLNGQKANVSFDKSKLSQSDQKTYDDAQNTLKTTAATQAAQTQSAQATRDSAVSAAQATVASLNTEIAGLQAQNVALQNDINAKQQEINSLENNGKDTPSKPSDNGGKDTPSNPDKPSDNTGHNGDTPANPDKPSDNTGHNGDTPSNPVTPSDNTGHNGDVTPNNNGGKDAPAQQPSADTGNMGHNGPAAPDNNGSQTTGNDSEKQAADQPAGRHFADDTSATTPVADNYVPRHAANADNQANALPQTGQSNDSALTISGMLAVIASLLLGLGSFFKFRKEN